MAKLLHERLQLFVIRCQSQELLGVWQLSGSIAGLAAEVDQRDERVAVLGMPNLALPENSHGLRSVARGVQGNGVHIGVAGVGRIELGGATEFVDCFRAALQADQRQTEGVVEAGICRRQNECRAQDLLRLVVMAELAMEIGEIDRGRARRAG